MIQLQDEIWDGFSDVCEVVAAVHKTPTHAIVERSVFPPRALVTHTGGRPIVNAVRAGSFDRIGRRERRSFISAQDAAREWDLPFPQGAAKGVYVDDNFCAHTVFNACFDATWVGGTFTHLAHVFDGAASKSPMFFTALPNLILVPAWLAKFTDADEAVRKSLRWIARRFYGFCAGATCSKAPKGPGCELCKEPGHNIEADVVEASISRWERRAVRPEAYKPELMGKTKLWKDALSSCTGYTHTFYTAPGR